MVTNDEHDASYNKEKVLYIQRYSTRGPPLFKGTKIPAVVISIILTLFEFLSISAKMQHLFWALPWLQKINLVKSDAPELS